MNNPHGPALSAANIERAAVPDSDHLLVAPESEARPVGHLEYAYALSDAGTITAISEDLSAALGYGPTELVGRKWSTLTSSPPREIADPRTVEQELGRLGRARDELLELRGKDGQRLLVLTRTFRLAMEGDAVLLVGLASPVTTSDFVDLSFDQVAMAISEDMRVVGWNPAAERLTGISSASALGRPCWEVLAAKDASGSGLCSPSCALLKQALSGEEVDRRQVRIGPGGDDREHVLATLGARCGSHHLVLHLIPGTHGTRKAGSSTLTPRQHEVLSLLAEGLSASEIANHLVISLVTVNNHIQAILRALKCHSRLEAVAEARRLSLI